MKFIQYLQLSESLKDLHSAIGEAKTKELLNVKVDPKVQKEHDRVFSHGNEHIEIPLQNSVPEKVIEHVKSQSDSMDGDKVKLKSGRSVELSKYLPHSKAPKSVIDDHQNYERNKGSGSNSKLVISRRPAVVAAASTGKAWSSCAEISNSHKGPAAEIMSHELKHGTLIALHVHKDAKPNEHGEYESKDIHGRVLIKRHNDENGDISFHREDRQYGAFHQAAKEAADKFTAEHYNSEKDGIHTNNKHYMTMMVF